MKERVRFCASCNAIIGWYAMYCETCGKPQKKEPSGALAEIAAGEAGPLIPGEAVPPFEPRAGEPGERRPDADALSQQVFKGHLHLVHRYREKVEAMLAEVARMERRLGRAEEAKSPDVPVLARAFADRMEEMFEGWERVQEDYNKDSAALDEDFVDRYEELEVDVQLPPELETAVAEELEGFTHALETLTLNLNATHAKASTLSRERRLLPFSRPGSASGVLLLVLVMGLLPAAAIFLIANSAFGLRVSQAALCSAPSLLPLAIALGAFARR